VRGTISIDSTLEPGSPGSARPRALWSRTHPALGVIRVGTERTEAGEAASRKSTTKPPCCDDADEQVKWSLRTATRPPPESFP
jgi:hypothetical protein